MYHPWDWTLEAFIERAGSEYGLQLHFAINKMRGPRGVEQWQYLVGKNPAVHVLVPGSVEPGEILEPEVLRYLCEACRLPPEDFGLDPDPDA